MVLVSPREDICDKCQKKTFLIYNTSHWYCKECNEEMQQKQKTRRDIRESKKKTRGASK